MKTIERFLSSRCATREAIKFAENSAQPEVDFELNQGEIVFRKFLPNKAALAETNYGPFVFWPEPIYGQKRSEIDFSTCAVAWSIFIGSGS